jgi:hypothetical protein
MMDVIKKIRTKKELKDLDEDYIVNRVGKLNLKNKEDFKNLRAQLRKVYGMFKNLKFTRSDEVYDKIFAVTGKPKKILDLGCGVNPLHFPFKNIEYYASDIGHEYVDDSNEYFKENKIKGKAFIFDLLSGDYSKLPKVDVVFLFRVLESLEYYIRNYSKEVIEKLNAKYIVVSFDKEGLSRKRRLKKKGRIWFRRILRELGYHYEIIDFENEIFFVIHTLLTKRVLFDYINL